jgi:hypothetical protein
MPLAYQSTLKNEGHKGKIGLFWPWLPVGWDWVQGKGKLG